MTQFFAGMDWASPPLPQSHKNGSGYPLHLSPLQSKGEA
ncbi:hypothetical protein SAMN05216602_2640 [Pseudomonas argentinensis]|uniref:Uncharacterized protein n=1 Tax=Phytopseudomonas argentinensis TaxID=289370 RepID=A0A1I3KQ65_9GAMM|nr:hypothetical protein SAMN05216602_2640 [Pseudomonas argentinensis]